MAAGWRRRLRAALYALYRRRGGDPAFPAEEEIEELADLIDEGRAEPGAPASLTRVTAEALSGAILQELYLAGARRRPLPPEDQMVPYLLYMAVLPYIGADAASEELRVPPP
ncbi:MAG: hypothetical protein ACM3JL_01320 [Nitrososphaerota archaeon]